MVLIGDHVVVFQVESELYSFDAEALSVSIPELDFSETTLLRSDPSDEFRFLCLGDGRTLWSVEFDGDDFWCKKPIPVSHATAFASFESIFCCGSAGVGTSMLFAG
jgi:hypothetical protein